MATLRKRRGRGERARAVGYVRMSTSKQDLSPGVQGAALDAWASSEGVDMVAVYFDLGASGGLELGDRPGLAGALASLPAHGATVLVAAKRDRFAREVGIAADIDRLASKAGARTMSADGWGNGDDDGAALQRDLGSVLAAHERRLIKRRTRDALALKRARGERTGGVPYGKRIASDGAHRTVDGKKLCPAECVGCLHLEDEPGERATIARAKALSDEGLSVRAIAARLEGERHVGRTGRPLSHTQVHRALRPLLLAESGE